jgi:hypothetical protein
MHVGVWRLGHTQASATPSASSGFCPDGVVLVNLFTTQLNGQCT